MIRLFFPALVLGAVGLAGCGSDAPSGAPPEGVACSSTSVASDAASVKQALAGAASGSCVVVTGGSVEGSFEVPAGVALVGARDSRPSLVASAATPNVVVVLREGASLANLRIDGGGFARYAIDVAGGNAKIANAEVTGAKGFGIAAATPAQGLLELNDVTIVKNAVGLLASGRNVTMRGGKATENGGTVLSSGYGIVAANGANVELDGVTIAKNDIVGLLVDGATTKVTMKNAQVIDNGGRGVWIQKVAGTMAAPSVRIEETQVARNKVVGVGSFESRGIIIVGGRVGETIAAPVVTNLATTEQVGDGIGLFGGSGDVEIKNTAIEANARAAGIIDGSDVGIIIVGGKIGAGPSGLKFVVQNSSATIQLADGDRSMAPTSLGISADKIPIPAP